MENRYDKLFAFVKANTSIDSAVLRLKYHGREQSEFDVDMAITQIECRRKFGKKLAETLHRDQEFLFPSVLAGEQATSDRFADFHASLVDESTFVGDLTAGLGIDIFHIARNTTQTLAVELDIDRFNVLQYNALRMAPKLKAIHADCRDFVKEYDGKIFDALFIDPARRAEDGSRVFNLAQCSPDVIAMLPGIKRISQRLIVKMSPMLDISKTIADIRSAIGACGLKMYAVGTPGECRELLAVIDFNFEGESEIVAVTLHHDAATGQFGFTAREEADAMVEFGMPVVGDFLYEPYASVMKVAPWKLFASRYGLKAVSANSHVYFGDRFEDEIPASKLQIIDVIPYTSSNIKRLRRQYPKASIACRNFDVTPEQLRKKLKIAEGDSVRLLATKNAAGEPFLLLLNPCGPLICYNKKTK